MSSCEDNHYLMIIISFVPNVPSRNGCYINCAFSIFCATEWERKEERKTERGRYSVSQSATDRDRSGGRFSKNDAYFKKLTNSLSTHSNYRQCTTCLSSHTTFFQIHIFQSGHAHCTYICGRHPRLSAIFSLWHSTGRHV